MAEERVESEGFYEMLWDCDHCETKGLLGKSQRFCANCGSPQNPDKRYLPKEGEGKKVEGHQFVGADRKCPACDAPMSANGKNCTNCGSPMDGSKEVKGVAAPPPTPLPKKRLIWPWIVGVVVVLGFVIWFQCIRKHEAEMVVGGHRWERSVAIEVFGDYPESKWRNEVPPNATGNISCRQEQRSTRQVPDGEDCKMERHDKKDGTFEQVKRCTPKTKSEPVMDDKCSYTVRRWQKTDEAKTSGNGMSLATPPNLPAGDTAATIGARRQGAKTDKLYLDFGPGQSCDVDDAIWRKYADKQKVKLQVRAASGDIVCSSL